LRRSCGSLESDFVYHTLSEAFKEPAPSKGECPRPQGGNGHSNDFEQKEGYFLPFFFSPSASTSTMGLSAFFFAQGLISTSASR